MASQYLAAFVTKEEYKEHLKTQIPFKCPIIKYLKISTIQNFDAYSSVCYFFYANDNQLYRPLMENDIRMISPIINYFEKGEEFYVTANGIVFHKVLDVRVNEQKYLEVSLLLMTNSKYTEFNHSFMIMPFREEKLNSFYNETIKTHLSKRLGISIFRADDFNDNDVIIDTIYREIEKSEFIICEISQCNKNVFFEIGYAKAMKKELIFLLQRGKEHNFFDVAHIRRIDYDLDNPIELQAKLTDTIEHIRGKR